MSQISRFERAAYHLAANGPVSLRRRLLRTSMQIADFVAAAPGPFELSAA